MGGGTVKAIWALPLYESSHYSDELSTAFVVNDTEHNGRYIWKEAADGLKGAPYTDFQQTPQRRWVLQ